MDKKTSIVLIIAIIIICIAGISSFIILDNHSKNKPIVNNTTVENITNVTEDVKTTSNSVAHGYCAICGAPLSATESSDEYTQGKVCSSCAKNPYYQTDLGASYANQKLEDAYPEDYNGIADENKY